MFSFFYHRIYSSRWIPFFKTLPVDIVFDHFSMIPVSKLESPSAKVLFRLLELGRAWVTLSGTYRIASDPYEPTIPFLADRLFSINPDRLVWGSDWPHTPNHSMSAASNPVELPYRSVDTRKLLKQLWNYFGEPCRVQKILAENPAQLYDFPT